MKNIYFLIALLFSTFISYSQTNYTIEYSYETLNSNCNVFASELTIDNIKHQSTKGFPKFDGTNYFVKLACKKNSSTDRRGTEYQLIFPFKKNHRYQINIKYQGAVSNSQTENYPFLAVKLNPTKKNHYQSTTCNGLVATTPAEYSVFGSSGSTLNWAKKDFIDQVLQTDCESLSIGSLPWDGANSTGNQEILIRAIQIIETAPPPTPPANDEYSGAITVTPSSSSTCTQTIVADFTSSTITQLNYEDFGYNGSTNNPIPSSWGDIWYKFTATNASHEIAVSTPSYGVCQIELFSINGSNLKLIDRQGLNLKASGLNIGQTYYIRLIFRPEDNQSKNVSLNMCVSTPVIQSASLSVKLRYDYTEGYMYDGNTLAVSFTIPQNISRSDLSFDWRVVSQNGQDGTTNGGVNGTFLYPEGGSRVNNGTYSLLNVQNTRVKIGLDPKSPQYQYVPFWLVYVEVRIKQISTNTYLSDWIRGGYFYTEL